MQARRHALRIATLAVALCFAALVASVLTRAADDLAPAGSAPQSASLPVLGPSPAWSLTDLDGKPVGSEALRGKVVVVDFWATWCGPCVQEIPGYIELQKKHGERGLVVVGLSIDRKGEAAVRPFAKRLGVNYPLALATPEVAEAFGGIEVVPTTILIDREGRVRHRKTGAMETADYEKLILPLL
jgi:thiol-disulfide isomerase/thioredoxin